MSTRKLKIPVPVKQLNILGVIFDITICALFSRIQNRVITLNNTFKTTEDIEKAPHLAILKIQKSYPIG